MILFYGSNLTSVIGNNWLMFPVLILLLARLPVEGSILGPLLFLIYANDMLAVVNNKLLLYADDFAFLVTGKDRLQIEQEFSKKNFSLSVSG